MRAAGSLLLYELRRHAPLTLGGWLLLLVPLLIHRLSSGSWGYWGSEWKEPMAAVAAYLVAPVLAFYLASSGWAAERTQGTLRWLYARPLPAMRIYLLRLLAVFVLTAVWTVVAVLLNGVTLSGLAAWISDSPLFSVRAWFVLAGLGLSGGCLASVLFRNRDAIILSSLAGALALLFLVPWLTLEFAPTADALLTGGRVHLMNSMLLYGGLLILALLAGAGYAMHRTPADRLRRRRAAVAAAPLVIVALAALWILILQPLRITPQISSVHWLGDGVTLRFVGAPGLEPWVRHPVLDGGEAGEQILRTQFAMPELVLAHPGTGRAMVREVGHFLSNRLKGNHWLLIDRRGEVSRLDLGSDRRMVPIGWSPDGSRFAWKEIPPSTGDRSEAFRMAVLNDDGEITSFSRKIPTPEFTAAWIDDERLLVVPSMLANHSGWWMVVRDDGRIEHGPEMLPESEALFSPSFAYPVEFYRYLGKDHPTFRPVPQVLYGRDPVLFMRNCNDETNQLVILDADAGEFHAISEADRATPMACGKSHDFIRDGLVSIGSLADGSLVWAEPVPGSGTNIVALLPTASRRMEVCTFEGNDVEIGGYRGSQGPWALWSDLRERRLLACQVETGEVRTLDLHEYGGARAVDIVDGGVLTAEGILELDGEMR